MLQIHSLNKLVVIVFSAALALLGLYILFSGGVALPTRQPAQSFQFSGLSLLFLGLSPLFSGVVCLAIAQGAIRRDALSTYLAIGFSIASLGLAFILATKAP